MYTTNKNKGLYELKLLNTFKSFNFKKLLLDSLHSYYKTECNVIMYTNCNKFLLIDIDD